MLILIIFLLLCLLKNNSYAFEDPRWERSAPKQSIQKVKEVKAPVVEVINEDILSKYEEEKLKKTLSTLKESPMPLRLPDTVLRVMFLPYVDSKNVLRNSYYTFMKVEDGKWVLGEYLTAPNTTRQAKGRVFTPLQAPLPVRADDKVENKEDSKKTEGKEEE